MNEAKSSEVGTGLENESEPEQEPASAAFYAFFASVLLAALFATGAPALAAAIFGVGVLVSGVLMLLRRRRSP